MVGWLVYKKHGYINHNSEGDVMKKILLTVAASFLLVSCAAIKQQMNLYTLMQTYQFNGQPGEVYQAATVGFSKIGLPLTASSKTSGVSAWRVGYVSQGSLSHNEKYRYKVDVLAVGNNHSTVRVIKESVPDHNDLINLGDVLGKDMLTPKSVRDMSMEFIVLKAFSPEEATRLEQKAATM